MDKILYKDDVFMIQGAVFEVYREMGCGFLEAVYQECLEVKGGNPVSINLWPASGISMRWERWTDIRRDRR